MPRKAPPQGFLGATEAANILGVSTAMLTIYVRDGKLHRYGPETRTYKFYKEDEVRALAEAEAAFFGAQKGEVSTGMTIDASFALATPADMDGVYELAVRLFGRAAGPEQRRAWLAKEPRGHYVMRRQSDGKIFASVYLLSVQHERLMAYVRDEIRARDIVADDILPYAPGVARECLIGSIASDPDLDQKTRSACVAMLLRGMRSDLERLGQDGLFISRVYAWSEAPLGIEMALNLEMKQWSRPKHHRHTFYLDVLESQTFLLQGYQQGFARWREQHPENNQEKEK